ITNGRFDRLQPTFILLVIKHIALFDHLLVAAGHDQFIGFDKLLRSGFWKQFVIALANNLKPTFLPSLLNTLVGGEIFTIDTFYPRVIFKTVDKILQLGYGREFGGLMAQLLLMVCVRQLKTEDGSEHRQ